jgi:hypothetical protein
MALHFTKEELASRRAAAVAAMQKRGLDGLLMSGRRACTT